MKAIYTVGVSGSGKTTWAEQQEDFQIVSRDFSRYSILSSEGLHLSENMWSKWSFKREKEVDKLVDYRINSCHTNGQNIIFADTNLNSERLKHHQGKMQALGYEVETKYFPIDFETAVKRDTKRRDTVGEAVIRKQWLQWLKLPEEFIGVRKYIRDYALPTAVIVDVDGTVAEMWNRGAFDWELVEHDKPRYHVMTMVDGLSKTNDIIFLSGRDGCCFEATKIWLENYFPDLQFQLFMRAEGDMRKDSVIKAEIFHEHIENQYNVVCAIDDRKQMVRMWTDLGIDVVDVGNHYEEF